MAIEISDISKGKVIARPSYLNDATSRGGLAPNIAKLASDLRMIDVQQAIKYSTDEFSKLFFVKETDAKSINKRLAYVKTQCRKEYKIKARGVLDNGNIIIWKCNI